MGSNLETKKCLEVKETNVEILTKGQRIEETQIVGSQETQQSKNLTPEMLRWYSMLLLQVILSKAGIAIQKLNDTPEKQLQRRLNYAYLMEEIDNNKKSPSSNIINRTLTAIQPRFLPTHSAALPPKPMKSTTSSNLSHLPPKKRRTRNLSSQSNNSQSSQTSLMQNCNQSVMKQDKPFPIWPLNSQKENIWLKNFSENH